MNRCILWVLVTLGVLCCLACGGAGNVKPDRVAAAPAQPAPVSSSQEKAAETVEPAVDADLARAAQDDTPELQPKEREPRTWLDDTGKFSVVATLVEIDGFEVSLQKADGAFLNVPIAKLCASDRMYIERENKQIQGKVTQVTDGNVLSILDRDKQIHEVRLEGVDAPENDQDYGPKAKAKLSDTVLDKDVRVRVGGRDKHGRTLGAVYFGTRWINLELVEGGLAWHYARFSKSQRLANAEKTARAKRLGLWTAANPTAPWEHRQQIAEAKRAAAERAKAERLASQRAEAEAKRLALQKTEAEAKRLAAERQAEAEQVERERKQKLAAAESQRPQSSAKREIRGYWLTTSTKVRHNSNCAHYGNSNGHSCGPSEGHACKVCGG